MWYNYAIMIKMYMFNKILVITAKKIKPIYKSH